ncbi:hypothetical protein [Roseofilum capinflatum]|uniref:Uncharacterized protein n=1 Tax=Roseofilum capinflatum BLCC-M114 TaxID=3022440 RepID=A0ABT7B3K4_9CYAN|nr:hypothetical protein [Roseofilum capinflatum]MDJ1173746.1 hypothetical protein [Roseofilum capinflatum BLCC-M114]
MSYDLIFLLEEPSMKDVLELILPQIFEPSKTYKCIPHQGKQDLAKSIPIKIKALFPSAKRSITHASTLPHC